jgi:hypothetical protein
MVEGMDCLSFSDSAEQLRHLSIILLLSLHGKSQVPQMCLGLGHETSFEILQGFSPFYPRNLMRDELLCLSTADRALSGLVSTKFHVVTISALPHIIYLL